MGNNTINSLNIIDTLNNGLMPATGCTEPIAIAYAAASASQILEEEPENITLFLSSNIIKNALGVGIPASKYKGIDFASSLGALYGDASKKSSIFEGLTDEQREIAYSFAKSGKVVFGKVEGEDGFKQLFYIEAIVKGKHNTARAIVEKSHLNLVLLEKNGEKIFEKQTEEEEVKGENPLSSVSLPDIYDIVENDMQDFSIFKDAISYNLAVAEQGQKDSYGLNVGKIAKKSLLEEMVAMTSSAVDARMAGVSLPVITNSGSGNQGITATVPVAIMAKSSDADELKTLKAVAISNYTAIYIKQHLNILSHLCGAVIASSGAAAGMTYLMGGDWKDLENAVKNTLASATGMMCDGAKDTCALKVATCVSLAFYSANLALNGDGIEDKSGIVSSSLDKTIKNIAEIEAKSSHIMNDIIFNVVAQHLR